MPKDYQTLLKSRKKLSEEEFKKIPSIEIKKYIDTLVSEGKFKDEII